MEYFIVEHPTRGIYVGFDHAAQTGVWRPHFRWSIQRDHEDASLLFSRAAAWREVDKIAKHGISGCYVVMIRTHVRGSGHCTEERTRPASVVAHQQQAV